MCERKCPSESRCSYCRLSSPASLYNVHRNPGEFHVRKQKDNRFPGVKAVTRTLGNTTKMSRFVAIRADDDVGVL